MHLDSEALLSTTEGDYILAEQLCQMLLSQATADCITINQAVESEDRDTIHRTAHKLKGAAVSIHALRLAQLAAQLEIAAITMPLPEISQHWKLIELAINDFQSAMTKFIEDE